MHIREEINKFAAKDDVPILTRLFDKYHMQSTWRFVANSSFEGQKGMFLKNRIWKPTAEGYVLYEWLKKKK